MGIDYFAGHAMCLSDCEMVKLINGKNKKPVLEVIQSFHDSVIGGQYTSDKAKKAITALNNIDSKIKLADLRELIIEYHTIEGDAGKYEGDCRFANGLDGYQLLDDDDFYKKWYNGSNFQTMVSHLISFLEKIMTDMDLRQKLESMAKHNYHHFWVNRKLEHRRNNLQFCKDCFGESPYDRVYDCFDF